MGSKNCPIDSGNYFPTTSVYCMWSQFTNVMEGERRADRRHSRSNTALRT